jgi:hypothetical protein
LEIFKWRLAMRPTKLILLTQSLAAAVAIFSVSSVAIGQSVDSFDRGFRDGYAHNIPPGGVPSPTNSYGSGFQLGLDDAADDDRMFEKHERDIARTLRPSPTADDPLGKDHTPSPYSVMPYDQTPSGTNDDE